MNDFHTDIFEIVEGSLADYKILAEYHYRTEPIKPCTNIYKVQARAPLTESFPNPIAIIVYRMPLPDLRARTKATNGFFHKPPTRPDRLKLVNKHIRYLARLIVDPRFQKLGIATDLLKTTLPLQQYPIIETLTPIDFTNKIFTKAGFQLHYTPAPDWYNRFANMIRALGLAPDHFLLASTLQHRLENLDSLLEPLVEKEIKAFMKHFLNRANMPPDLKRSEFILTKLSFPEAYLIWYNPEKPITGLKTGDPGDTGLSVG